MKRMYSEKQVQEIIKKAIESGEIIVGRKIYQHHYYCELDGKELFFFSKQKEAFSIDDLISAYKDGNVFNVRMFDNQTEDYIMLGVPTEFDEDNLLLEIFGITLGQDTMSLFLSEQDLIKEIQEY